MWSTAIGLSWHPVQAATMGELTSVVGWALHGARAVQAATTPLQGCAVVQVQGVAGLQLVVTPAIFCVNDTGTLLTVYVPLTSALHGFAALHVQGADGVQATVAPPMVWVPLTP